MTQAGSDALFKYICSYLAGLIRKQSRELDNELHGVSRELNAISDSSTNQDEHGKREIKATQQDSPAARADGAEPAPAARTVTDLSHMPPLGDLVDGAARGDLDSYELTEALRGLERRYGPYDLARVAGWSERGHIMISAKIRADGADIGKLIYQARRDTDGELVVSNKISAIQPKFRGRGFSTAFSEASEQYFRRSGVDRLEVETVSGGGYTWAKAGYGWNRAPEQFQKSIGNISNRIDDIITGENPPSGHDAALLETVKERLRTSGEELPTPLELATLAGDDTKLGERIMRNTTWHGVKFL